MSEVKFPESHVREVTTKMPVVGSKWRGLITKRIYTIVSVDMANSSFKTDLLPNYGTPISGLVGPGEILFEPYIEPVYLPKIEVGKTYNGREVLTVHPRGVLYELVNNGGRLGFMSLADFRSYSGSVLQGPPGALEPHTEAAK